MDLIRIDDNKMKIMLTPGDMQCYELDADTMDRNKSETCRAFRNILDEVRSRTGFDAKGNKIFVQMYPSREGGCEMFVTKLGMICALNDSSERPTLGTGRMSIGLQPRTQHNMETERNRTVAFTFDALEHLLCVCRRLRARAFPGNSAAYWGEEGRYYLLLSEKSGGRRSLLFDRLSLSFISEYGTQQNAEMVRLYIREHGCPICEKNAVARLADL